MARLTLRPDTQLLIYQGNTAYDFLATCVLLWRGGTHFESESGFPSPHAAGPELAGGL